MRMAICQMTNDDLGLIIITVIFMKIKKLISVIAFVAGSFSLTAQQPVAVGSGSYAEYTPLFKSATDQHGGDKSRIMETRTYPMQKKASLCQPTTGGQTCSLIRIRATFGRIRK